MKQDNLLFTPGPLTTSYSVKKAMLRDLGSRDNEFTDLIKSIRNQLLDLAGVSQQTGFEAVLIQGSGTYGIEAVISSCMPYSGHILIQVNGTYGNRIKDICSIYKIKSTIYACPENQSPHLATLKKILESDSTITHVAMVHCETTTGIVNPVMETGMLCRKYNKIFIVDAMSSFGAIPVDCNVMNIDFLISSANKCLEGVPGFSYVIARKNKLEDCKEIQRTLSFDLYRQWESFEKTGQFRFTPPTHTLLAFEKALEELRAEGGIEGRSMRYIENYEKLLEGMSEMGFVPYLDEALRGYIITAFYYPAHPNFNFEVFYIALKKSGFTIYPGKLSQENCFRIGNIGHIFTHHIADLLNAIRDVLHEMYMEPA